MSNSNRIVQGVDVSTKAGQFIFTKNSNGTWIISSAWDRNFVFDISGGSANDGAVVQIYRNNQTAAQSWGMSKIQNARFDLDLLATKYKDVLVDGTYYIASKKNTSFVLDVYGGSKDDFGNVQLYQNNGTVAQRWQISHDSKGYVTFINVGSNKAIDVYGGKASKGQNVNQFTANDSYAQKWIVTNEGNGYKIMF